MSYIAVDNFGVHLFINKPIRVFGRFNLWQDKSHGIWIDVPIELPRVLYENNMLGECHVPLYKRNMNWGNNPICVHES